MKRLIFSIHFVFFYLLKLIQANFYIAYDILTPGKLAQPGFVHIPLSIQSDLGILLFSNLVSMTPGSLSVDVNKEKTSLLVHVLYDHDEESVINELLQLQDRIKQITT